MTTAEEDPAHPVMVEIDSLVQQEEIEALVEARLADTGSSDEIAVGSAAEGLRSRDDDVDDLHVRLTTELGEGTLAPALAIEMGLVARFYERLGDHAVNVVRSLPRERPAEALVP